MSAAEAGDGMVVGRAAASWDGELADGGTRGLGGGGGSGGGDRGGI